MATRVIQLKLRHVFALVASGAILTALLPVGVEAATGSYVNIRDYYNSGTTGQARVINNHLVGTTCDVGTTTVSTSACARVSSGKLTVGDPGTFPAKPWSAHIEPTGSAAVLGPFAAGTKLAISSITVYLDSPSNAFWSYQVQDAPATGGCPGVYGSTSRGNRLAQYIDTHQSRQLTFPTPLVLPFEPTTSRWCLYALQSSGGYRLMTDMVGFTS